MRIDSKKPQWHRGVRHLRESDPVMRRVVEELGPCRLQVRPPRNPFQALAECIVYQQLTGKAAATIFGRLVALFPGKEFPTARELLATPPEMPDEAVVESLTQVRGIGRWSAEMYLIFRLGRPDVMPVGDLGLKKGVQRAYGLADLPVPEDLERLGEPWRPWRSVATWYFWELLSRS
ncbi:MAG: DNA-3-methyladenine glycosylase 2 family protein [Candidatus Wallbacteria bacterium]|nr:DNA-3-methyladenine glycosylase 2 family protein [Candidatus Wallbacteria bacterium]